MPVSDSHVLLDACVARAVGKNETSSPAREIRVILDDLRDGQVGLLMTPLLRTEWERHASPIMKKWLARMVTRKKVKFARDRRVSDFRAAAEQGAVDQAEVEALEKDAHITEAAILSRSGVISLDDRQLRLLARLVAGYPLVGEIQWFHPVRDRENCRSWISTSCVDVDVSRISAATT